MKKILLIILFLTSNAFGFEIEKIIQKDVTYDGTPEKIVYKVWGKNWDAPDWSFVIYDGDKIVYSEASTAGYWKMAEDRGEWQGCAVIAECKKKAYGPDRINRWFHAVNVGDNTYSFMLENFATNAPGWYRQHPGVTETKAKEFTKRLYDFLKGKQIIGLNAGAVGYGSLVTYDKFLKTFVTFWTP